MNNIHNIKPQLENEPEGTPSPSRIEKIEQLIQRTPDVVYRYRIAPTPGFEFINPAVEHITGFTPAEHYRQAGLGLSSLFPYDPAALKTLLSNMPSSQNLKALRFENHTVSGATEHVILPVYGNQGEVIAIEGIARDLTRWHSGDSASQSSFQSTLNLLSTSSASLKHAADIHSAASVIGSGLVELCQAKHGFLFSITDQGRLERLWTDLEHENGYDNAIHSLQGLVHLSSPLEITEWDWQIAHQDSERPTSPPQSHTFSSITCPIYSGLQLLAVGLCFRDGTRAFQDIQKQALQIFCQQAGAALENIRLSNELEDAYIQSILALARAIDARDTYTSHHSHRLMKWATSVAIQMGCSSAEVEVIGWAALLHDIGKIGIPDHILHKPAELDRFEWQQMRRHAEIGADIVSHIKKLRSAIPFIRFHHEHYDGNGYPEGLRGDQIPMGARILSVVDAYGAMIDRRVYRPARPPCEAVRELNAQSGLQFDPDVVRAFLRTLDMEGNTQPG